MTMRRTTRLFGLLVARLSSLESPQANLFPGCFKHNLFAVDLQTDQRTPPAISEEIGGASTFIHVSYEALPPAENLMDKQKKHAIIHSHLYIYSMCMFTIAEVYFTYDYTLETSNSLDTCESEYSPFAILASRVRWWQF
jgi:hypothetical protein